MTIHVRCRMIKTNEIQQRHHNPLDLPLIPIYIDPSDSDSGNQSTPRKAKLIYLPTCQSSTGLQKGNDDAWMERATLKTFLRLEDLDEEVLSVN